MNRTCTKCGRELPATPEFFTYADRKTGRFRGECKDCQRGYNREYYVTNHEDIIAATQQYRADNREKVNATRKRTYLRNRSQEIANRRKHYRANKARYAEWRRKWERENPERYRELSVKWARARRERIKTLEHTLTAVEWEECLAFFGHRCAYCGTGNRPLQREHFIPAFAGGGYTADNIIPACGRCNDSKGTREFEVWYPEQPYFTPGRAARIRQYFTQVTGTR